MDLQFSRQSSRLAGGAGAIARIGLLPAARPVAKPRLEQARQTLDQINRLLRQQDLPPYREPNRAARPDESAAARWHYALHPGMSNEFIRCAAAWADAGRLGVNAEGLAQLFETGLCGGVWLPLNFPTLIADGGLRLASAHRLREICQALALALEIPIPLDEIPCEGNGDGHELNDFFEGETGTRLWDDETGTEKELCIVLYHAACLSMASGLALWFDGSD